MSAATGAAFAGIAVAVALPTPASAAENPDAELLALCAEFEANMRSQNGLWQWQVWGQGAYLQGPNYIEDEDERDAAIAALDEPADALVDDIFQHTPATLSGFQALARCLVLSAGDMRDVVAGRAEGIEHLGFSFSEWSMVAALLRGLTGGAITDASCANAPMRLVTDLASAA